MCHAVVAVFVSTLILSFGRLVSAGEMGLMDDGEELSRIIGGVEVDFDDHPYVVVMFDWTRQIPFVGMGTIITPKLVLTVAHRFQNITDVTQMNVFQFNEFLKKRTADNIITAGTYRIPSIRVHRYPDPTATSYYNEAGQGQKNNIAVVELLASYRIKPMNLFDKGEELAPGISIGLLRISGSKLLRIAVTTMTRQECQKAYDGLHQLTDDQFCVNKSASEGTTTIDQGMPLLVNNRLAGVLLGYPGVHNSSQPINKPIVFTSVSYHRGWIDEMVARLDPESLPQVKNDTEVTDCTEGDEAAEDVGANKKYRDSVKIFLISIVLLLTLILIAHGILLIKSK